MSKRTYSGDPLDMTYTPITERPELDDPEDVIYATEPETHGRETTENVSLLADSDDSEDDEPQRPVVPGQTKLSEWAGLGE
ncbi:hypothetical protein [Natrinema gelatinilyticum]|uniref:hypothetical protein n=1 Tax=Natrinema gelatinilyticum TaxID=2961571 RepID=UPI0020C50504|nr:hypothetical protein [Natrinema gelatinilyticum]